jgi:hypothetical protein
MVFVSITINSQTSVNSDSIKTTTQTQSDVTQNTHIVDKSHVKLNDGGISTILTVLGCLTILVISFGIYNYIKGKRLKEKHERELRETLKIEKNKKLKDLFDVTYHSYHVAYEKYTEILSENVDWSRSKEIYEMVSKSIINIMKVHEASEIINIEDDAFETEFITLKDNLDLEFNQIQSIYSIWETELESKHLVDDILKNEDTILSKMKSIEVQISNVVSEMRTLCGEDFDSKTIIDYIKFSAEDVYSMISYVKHEKDSISNLDKFNVAIEFIPKAVIQYETLLSSINIKLQKTKEFVKSYSKSEISKNLKLEILAIEHDMGNVTNSFNILSQNFTTLKSTVNHIIRQLPDDSNVKINWYLFLKMHTEIFEKIETLKLDVSQARNKNPYRTEYTNTPSGSLYTVANEYSYDRFNNKNSYKQ